MKRISILTMLVTLAASISAQDAATDDCLPTPYTAEQIRDSWPLGMQVVTRYTTPGGVNSSRTVVTAWSPEKVSMTDQGVDKRGGAVGEVRAFDATWEELRDHARFLIATSSRERTTRETPLGELDGWQYRVEEEDGGVSEFFFPDRFPGAPVVYSKTKDGVQVFLSEVISRELPTSNQ